MYLLYYLIIFIIILLVYLHIINEIKISDTLDIYEIDYVNNSNLQEISELKHPFIFLFENDFDQYSIDDSIDFIVKDCNDNNNDNIKINYSSLKILIDKDKKSKYYTEHNYEVCNNIISKNFYKFDKFLKPNLNVSTNYDYIFGSKGSFTPLRYHTNSRVYLYVKKGIVEVKMIPWKFEKLLDHYTEYDSKYIDNLSNINLWNSKINNVTVLEFSVNKDNILYIPPFWFYTIKFETDSAIYSFQYKNIFNIITNIPKLSLQFLQNSNTEKKIFKTIDDFNIIDENDSNSTSQS